MVTHLRAPVFLSPGWGILTSLSPSKSVTSLPSAWEKYSSSCVPAERTHCLFGGPPCPKSSQHERPFPERTYFVQVLIVLACKGTQCFTHIRAALSEWRNHNSRRLLVIYMNFIELRFMDQLCSSREVSLGLIRCGKLSGTFIKS